MLVAGMDKTSPQQQSGLRPVGRPIQARINRSSFLHNLNRVRELAPDSQVLCAIKANAYGHGLTSAAHILGDADALGVAGIDEALQLREAGLQTPIVLLEGIFHPSELVLVIRHKLTVVVHQSEQLEMLLAGPSSTSIQVWLKVDTGMHRLGFLPEVVFEVSERLQQCEHLKLMGYMTHLASADERKDAYTKQQLETFFSATRGMPGMHSIANSAGILAWPDSRTDWVRPGIMLYGVSPFTGGRAADEGLLPVMTLQSEVIAVNHYRKGDAVGYGGSWICPEDMSVGVIAAGYGDGYPRHARQGCPVLINGKRAPLIGRVSMDMITVDLRQHPAIKRGDPVILWGEGLPVEEVAEAADTIAYELLCHISARVPFIEVE